MKKLLNTIITVLFVSFATVSCVENEMELDKGETPLALSISATSIELEHRLGPNEALSFEWTSGTNKGTGAAILYTFEMDVKGNNFQSGIKKELGKLSSRLMKFTHQELNDSIKYFFPAIEVQEETEFEARIIAKIADEKIDAQTSNTVSFKVTTYDLLYMAGDATANGWNREQATLIGSVAGQKGVFSWSGRLKAGEFKFLVSTDDWLPSYNKGANDNTMVLRTSEEQPDDKFRTFYEGFYTITLNTQELTIDIAGEPRLWIIGDATSGGWSADRGTLMQPSGEEGGFEWQGTLYSGELKFITRPGSFLPSYSRGDDDTSLFYRTLDSEPDNKFRIDNKGVYNIRLNTRSLRIEIIRLINEPEFSHIWLMGDATPGGWSWNDVTAFTQSMSDKFEFVYEGTLNVGEFKCPVEINHNWNGKFIMPVTNHPELSELSYQVVQGGGLVDNKWQISEGGTYKVTINQRDETIRIVKQ